MGKKRSRQQSSNGVGDSSESDASQSHEKPPNSSKCVHVSKSVNFKNVRHRLNLVDIDNNNFCQCCSTKGPSNEVDGVHVCLQCGSKACSFHHAKEHTRVPRSDQHMLSLKLADKSVRCHSCDVELDYSTNRKLKNCVDNIENMYEKHLKAPVYKNSPKIEPICEESPPAKTELKAVPILPSETKNNRASGVKGLWNLGNTCFFNSVLQCLAQTPNLIETLRGLEKIEDIVIPLSNGRQLKGSLEKVDNFSEELAETLSNIKGSGGSFSPQKLLTQLQKRVHQFRGNDQHDAHELLRHLLDSVRNSDIKRYRKIILNELGLNDSQRDKVSPEKQKELKQIDTEVTEKVMLVPDQVFRGFLVSRLECCECHHTSDRTESFLDLSLPVTFEKPHPPTHRRKGTDEKGGNQMSKQQLKRERRLEKLRHREKHGLHNKKSDLGQGEGVPTILEQGELDPEKADDGDLDSEESDKKTEPGGDANSRKEMLCAGFPMPSDRISWPNNVNLGTSIAHPTPSRVNIKLTKEGVPDISQLSIYDSSQPQLKTFVRDSVTIAKAEPSWLDKVLEFPEAPSNDGSSLLHDVSNTLNSKTVDNCNDVGACEKAGKEEEISSDDRTFVRDSVTIAKAEEPSWLNKELEFPEPPSNEGSCLLNDVSNTPNSKTVDNCNEVGACEKAGKEEEISSDDRPKGCENSADGRYDLAKWVNKNVIEHEMTSSADNSVSWDESHKTSVSAPPLPDTSTNTTTNEENGAISDDESMVRNLFEDNTVDSCDECSIQTCLSQFTGVELMTGSNSVGCEKCTLRANKGKKDGKTVYTSSSKQLLISEAPPVLILHIKRFQMQMSSFRKLVRHVAFPLELDISEFCKKETVEKSPKKPVYTLYGIVEHSGTFSGGHYVAYVKVDEDWYYISDSHVRKMSEASVLKAQAYLLFYKLS